MGDRFRTCTLIADQIKNLGYRGDIGYQTILYGNVVEIRRVLMFLTEKLPKKSESQVIETEDLHHKLLKDVANCLQKHSTAPWTPLFCQRYNYEYDSIHRLWYSTNAENVLPFKTRPILLDSSESIFDQTKNKSECLTSVLENNALLRFDIQVLKTHNQSELTKPVPLKRKPKLPPKPSLLLSDADPVQTTPETMRDNNNWDALSCTNVTSGHTITVSNNDVMLRSAVEQLQHQILEEEISIRKIQEQLSEKQNAVRNLETDINTRKRFVDLLPNIDENCDKLKDYISNSDARSSILMSQWETHRRQLIFEVEALRNEKSVVTNYDKIQNEIFQSSRKIEALEMEIVEKQTYLAELQKDFKARSEKQPKNPHRNFYVKRILEIVANVKKQREEIDKVLSDVNVRQKEINSLSGKLERSFQATDQLMFEDAKKDDCIKRAYRTFVNIHELCAEISADIESTGQILREIRDLEDQIDLEKQNEMDKKLENLVSDLCEIRNENETLERKLAGER
uniref:Coiled-coil domain-containing protein 22 homolog n=1 Tax=Romanomermis culicivorax TaxID=13658 RepID=A0A915L3V7_ROMCU